MIVAIDGPAGSGKSSTARAVAERLGYLYLDTGAMYRSVALVLSRRQTNPEEATHLPPDFALRLAHDSAGEMRVFVGDEDVSQEIRSPEMGVLASRVSALPWVRDAMVKVQRETAHAWIAQGGGVVLDGRDIGTVVFPEADVKVFMEADVRERARRRYDELLARGVQTTPEAVERELTERDYRDATRLVAPLQAAVDAIRLDTTRLSPEEQVDFVAQRVLERG